MQTLDVIQGSEQWLAIRRQFHTASEAPAMMGASKYQTRADLLRQKATGYTPEVDTHKQALFDRGHAAEAAACAIVEEMIGEDLYPATGTDEATLLASFDGINMLETIGYEHKLWSESLAAQVRTGELEPHYFWQLEQEILVGSLGKVIFVCSDGTRDKFVSMEYFPVPGRARQLVEGWRQFDKDLAAYQHVEVLPAAVATVQPSLPAVVVRMDGALTVASNLPDFAVALRAYIANIPAKPSTDQEFADAEAACKALKNAETALEQAENNALSQMTDVEQMRRVVGDLRTLAKTTRLATEKLVAARKEAMRTEIYQEGVAAFKLHIEGLNKRIGRPYMPTLPVDFAGAIKNKRTVESLRDAVSTHLANAKIAANDVADKISLNLATLREFAADHVTLFPDTATLVLKSNDDLTALVKMRIAEHIAEAQRRAEALAEHERSRIREEEAAKARVELAATTAKEALEKRNAEALALSQVQAPSIAAPAAPYSIDKATSKITGYLPAAQAALDDGDVVGAEILQPALNMTRIAAILGFTVSAAFLESIGCKPALQLANSTLYHERQMFDILEHLGQHLSTVYAREKVRQRKEAVAA